MSEDDSDIPEDHVHFDGTCTCEHDPEQHGWGGCDVDGCDCEAHLEE